MAPVVKWGSTETTWRSSVAAALSAIIPGSGQLYSGKTIPGLIWLPAVVLSYLASTQLGLCAHFVCTLDATEHRDFRGPLEDELSVEIPAKAVYALGAMVFVVVNTAVVLLVSG